MGGTPEKPILILGTWAFKPSFQFSFGFVLHAQLARRLLMIQRGTTNPSPRDLGNVKLLLTQQPPNELSVNESEADGLDCSGNTLEV